MHMSHLIPFLLFLFFSLDFGWKSGRGWLTASFFSGASRNLRSAELWIMSASPIIITIRNNPRFVLQEHTIGEEEWVFKESESSFRILLLLISPKRFFIAEFIAIQLVFVATMNLPFLSISLLIAPSYPSKLAFPALSPSSQRLLLSRKSFLWKDHYPSPFYATVFHFCAKEDTLGAARYDLTSLSPYQYLQNININ